MKSTLVKLFVVIGVLALAVIVVGSVNTTLADVSAQGKPPTVVLPTRVGTKPPTLTATPTKPGVAPRVTTATPIAPLKGAAQTPTKATKKPAGPGALTYTSGFQLQNLSGTTANITITYYNQDGTTAASPTDTIAANSSKTYFPLSAVTSGFNGSVVVSSNQQLAAITNVLIQSGSTYPGGASYSGFTSGATTVSLPLIMKNNYGISTWFNVQNVGNEETTVNVTYAGNPSPPGGCPESQLVKANAAKTFDNSTNSCLPSGFVGAATLTASQNIVATVMQIQTGSNILLAYNGFISQSTNPVMPLVSSNYYNSGTGIQIMNTGSSSTNVTLSYTPSSGFPGASCTETKSIPAGSSVTFGFPQLPAGCGTGGTGVTDPSNGGFVGSAKVTANSASMPLVAIVNQITRGTATSAAYNAVNPANATSRVSLPLLMDRNYGIFTGFSVANVGSLSTNISCTYSGTGAPPNIPPTSVPPGAALTVVNLNQATAGWVGAATCTATGGDAKIAAIVNELTQGTASTIDALLVYEGFNY